MINNKKEEKIVEKPVILDQVQNEKKEENVEKENIKSKNKESPKFEENEFNEDEMEDDMDNFVNLLQEMKDTRNWFFNKFSI